MTKCNAFSYPFGVRRVFHGVRRSLPTYSNLQSVTFVIATRESLCSLTLFSDVWIGCWAYKRRLSSSGKWAWWGGPCSRPGQRAWRSPVQKSHSVVKETQKVSIPQTFSWQRTISWLREGRKSHCHDQGQWRYHKAPWQRSGGLRPRWRPYTKGWYPVSREPSTACNELGHAQCHEGGDDEPDETVRWTEQAKTQSLLKLILKLEWIGLIIVDWFWLRLRPQTLPLQQKQGSE